jgi:hypothetical protein
MEQIKDTVYSVIGSLAEKKPLGADDDPEVWLKKVLTKKELGHIKFNYFKKGVLGVSVDSSSFLYSLTLRKTQILEGLTRCSNKIKDVRFRIGVISEKEKS